jgi:hypothetical protein
MRKTLVVLRFIVEIPVINSPQFQEVQKYSNMYRLKIRYKCELIFVLMELLLLWRVSPVRERLKRGASNQARNRKRRVAMQSTQQ